MKPDTLDSMKKGRPPGTKEPVWNKPCPHCGRVIRTRGGLHRHMTIEHGDSRTHQRVCSKCEQLKAVANFPKISGTNPPRYRSECFDCKALSGKRYESLRRGERTARQRRDRNKASRLKFGLTLDEYDSKIEGFLESQKNRCPGCGAELIGSHYHLDHHHGTMFIRGVLCRNCNIALGLAKDSPEVLRNLAEYLELTYRNYQASLELPTNTAGEEPH